MAEGGGNGGIIINPFQKTSIEGWITLSINLFLLFRPGVSNTRAASGPLDAFVRPANISEIDNILLLIKFSLFSEIF
jgi:hypothetical protein